MSRAGTTQNWMIGMRRSAPPTRLSADPNRQGSVAGTSLQAARAGLTLRTSQALAPDDRCPADPLAATDSRRLTGDLALSMRSAR